MASTIMVQEVSGKGKTTHTHKEKDVAGKLKREEDISQTTEGRMSGHTDDGEKTMRLTI